ncbi:uncharacterized protein FFB20_14029 [Fusarium fujikuroi]|nr:uncharacterized protein Y057_7134 [Fusarium fujikuroi]SCN97257.1 uncharacterized protein FFC1_07815 [Fusarium fujikuroi]SCO12579.1 uncharacterized protein FFB20_14029 [Fusarium fujikuroi]SCO39477.1 uncharacterized protein FFNC_06811 [Fusarium fujikuroi]
MARYFGQASPTELRDLERNAVNANDEQMATAAAMLQKAFDVLATDVRQVRAILAPYTWAIISYYEIMGSIQERMFVDIGENGQLVGVDVVLSGQLGTPILGEEDSLELITPQFQTPQGNEVPVIFLTWQVEGKLKTWISRKKRSDYLDLVFLFREYGNEIRNWSEHLSKDWRREFYETLAIWARYHVLGDVEEGKVEGEDMTVAESIEQDAVGYKYHDREYFTKASSSYMEHKNSADGH